MKGSLSSAAHRAGRGPGEAVGGCGSPTLPREGRARGIGGVAPGQANSADPSRLPGEEEECQGVVFFKQNHVFNCFFPHQWKEPYATADPSEQNGCVR